jgi:hypothetical protein
MAPSYFEYQDLRTYRKALKQKAIDAYLEELLEREPV